MTAPPADRPPPAPRRRVLRVALALLLLLLAGPRGAAAADPPPIEIRVLGGLASISQYVRYEAPFWTERVPVLTQGRLRAEVAPFDRIGIRGQEMLQLMRLGVVSFGTVLLGLAAADEPELNAIDLPLLNPDIATLRRTEQLWRPRLEALLRERYGIRLLAVYTYPAQVTFCRQPFAGLNDLAGRRVRVSSVGQAELVTALGATPVVTPFAEIVTAIRAGVVQCAVTGALSGNAIGLQEVTSHVSRVAISWGVSIFGANQRAWAALPEDIRTALAAGLAELQDTIWHAAEQETEDGLACNAGRPTCVGGARGRMIVVEDRPQEQARRHQLLGEVVLPAWVQRCGADCAETWNRIIGGVRNLPAKAD
ncbi:TRAP transporter substrate-binding protein [Paracraurococcus ruber]|uniref:ABC transporter substrate-binding protein n=1 Tax=Paracraurococcus ruber TaxID=77675 RepID=A0ABS1CX38_9PROT|nr:TRAP transporter substrate-binding protein [Paracraurococcus ruber]MBK1658990.1 ABC transporter substrate-binding protein [Paracraurococcus ruber]TDG32595.1 ABC transporter substrate-binding protein [Paracraurococcus ruber]